MELFNKIYDGESIVDLERDMCEVFDKRFNPKAGNIPQDEHGFHTGSFKVTVEWIPEQTELIEGLLDKIDEAKRLFGSYTYCDKGPHEVMDIREIVSTLRSKPVKEVQDAMYALSEASNEGSLLASALIGSMDDWDELFEDERIQQLY